MGQRHPAPRGPGIPIEAEAGRRPRVPPDDPQFDGLILRRVHLVGDLVLGVEIPAGLEEIGGLIPRVGVHLQLHPRVIELGPVHGPLLEEDPDVLEEPRLEEMIQHQDIGAASVALGGGGGRGRRGGRRCAGKGLCRERGRHQDQEERELSHVGGLVGEGSVGDWSGTARAPTAYPSSPTGWPQLMQ